jgi:hypothetical protein
MNLSVTNYYYYVDNYNYSARYMYEYGLSKQVAIDTGIGYILFAGITLALYLRLLTVWLLENKRFYFYIFNRLNYRLFFLTKNSINFRRTE